MNYAHWQAEQAQKSTKRLSGIVGNIFQNRRTSQEINEPVLATYKRENERNQKSWEGDGSLPAKASLKKIIAEDQR